MVKYISFRLIICYLSWDFSANPSGLLSLIPLINFFNFFHKFFKSAKKSPSSAKVSERLKCISVQVSFECLSCQVPGYPSALQVPECLKSPSVLSTLSAQVPLIFGLLFHCFFKCSPSALGMLIDCSSALRALLELLSSTL